MRSGVRVAAFVGAVLAFLAATGTAAAQQPNIVLVVTDDQRADTLRYMPNVRSELVGHGVEFKNAFVTNPLCCPSRASLLTGGYSHTTRVYRNAPPLGGFKAFDDRSTLATWLDAAGYETAFFGKYLNSYRGSYVPPGWDHWTAFKPPGYDRYGLVVDGAGFPAADRQYSTDFLADEAVSYIGAAASPFFVYLAPYAPHKPAIPAERHATRFSDLPNWRPPSYNEADVSDKPGWVRGLPQLDSTERRSLDRLRRNQLRTLLAVDEAVARLVQALRDAGQLENTLIVYTSDNGFLWGEHRWRRKTVAYEESIRVPFVVRYDALVSAARQEARHAANIDIAPTLAELAGVRAPGADGRSLVPLLTGEATPWRSRFLVESLDRRPPTYCALRTTRYAYVAYRTGERELYDLEQDPYELRNMTATSAGRSIAAGLRTPLARLCDPPPPGLSRKVLCTQIGSAGLDTLVGTGRLDILCAKGGADRIRARSGRDYVYAGGGRDRVAGGGGDDRIHVRDGARDAVTCAGGADKVWADSVDAVAADCERVIR